MTQQSKPEQQGNPQQQSQEQNQTNDLEQPTHVFIQPDDVTINLVGA